ncbi:MAG: ribonuclease J [Turicibacter sp.]|nr:ribonuclease J [Turicibacter sp.]
MGKIKVIPLGGMGEIGKNMTAIEYEDEIIVIDCGSAFPGEDMYGIDLIIPDIHYLLENQHKVKGLFVTHGHEDHIGAIPFILKQLNMPIYTTRLTMGLIERKISEHGLIHRTQFHVVKERELIAFDQIQIEFLHTTHSIADACALAIHTPIGVIFHTGDFKVDLTPIDEKTIDFERIGDLAKEGILLLISDSTNVERKGFGMSESEIQSTFLKLFKEATGRILVSTFASNIHRIQQIIDAAAAFGRKVAFGGRSMVTMAEVAMKLGYLDIMPDQLIDLNGIDQMDDDKLCLIVTGSQGEPMGALARIAFSNHRQIKIRPNDYIIISASPIPGNDKLIGRVINELYRHHATVIYKELADVHTSGHAYQEELKLMLRLTRPKYFLPAHGEYRHLIHHKNLAMRVGIPEENIRIIETGNVLEVSLDGLAVTESVQAGDLLVDGIGVGDIGDVVLRDRKLLAESGIVVVVATIDRKLKTLVTEPYIMTRGFIHIKTNEELLDEIKDIAEKELRTHLEGGTLEMAVLKTRVKKSIERYIYDKTKRRPGIFPIIMIV